MEGSNRHKQANLRDLTQNGTDDFGPAWSPDGSQIALSSRRDGNFEIYVMSVDSGAVDGGDPRRLTNNSTIDMSPAWQPVPGVAADR